MRYVLQGTIASTGFASGHRFVVGRWRRGPLGPMNDVMWVDPDGIRTLVASNSAVADFIGAIYVFDRIEIDPDLAVETTPRSIRMHGARLDLMLRFGRGLPLPLGWTTSPVVHRFLESPVAQLLTGSTTYGVTSRGISEWYCASKVSRVTRATASIDGTDQGAQALLSPALQVGFSEPPRWPTVVSVRPVLSDPSGALDRQIEASRRLLDL